MKKQMAIISLISLLAFAPLLMAQPQHDMSKCDFHGAFSKLNLTTEQLNKFKEMKLDFQKEILPLKNELKVKRLELESLILSQKTDKGKINAIIEEMGKLRTEVQKKTVAHRLAMREQLTNEQKAIWDSMPPKGMVHGFGKHRGGPRCGLQPCPPGQEGRGFHRGDRW